jgi:hypothetical protein
MCKFFVSHVNVGGVDKFVVRFKFSFFPSSFVGIRDILCGGRYYKSDRRSKINVESRGSPRINLIQTVNYTSSNEQN